MDAYPTQLWLLITFIKMNYIVTKFFSIKALNTKEYSDKQVY